MTDSDLAWHFLGNDGRMRYFPHTTITAGQTYTAEGALTLCKNGLHASVRAIDALKYARGSIICRVRLGTERLTGEDKVCARERTVLWMVYADTTLHEFACLVAEQAVAEASAAGYAPDPRSTEALTAKRAWLRRDLGDAALVRAADAARAAAEATNRLGVRTAAWDAAWSAARAVTLTGAWCFPWEMALSVARSAANATCWLAGRGTMQVSQDDAGTSALADAETAAWRARWASMGDDLERMVLALAPPERFAA